MHDGSPKLSVYKRNGDEFTRLSVSFNISGQLTDCSFTLDGSYLFCANGANTWGSMFKRNGDQVTQILTSGVTLAYVTSCAFSPDGTYLALSSRDAPFSYI